MSDYHEHSYIPKLKQQFVDGRCSRREFLRTATLIGMSATAAYAFVGKVTGESFVSPAKASMPKGGTLRIGQRILDLSSPHAYSWFEETVTRQVCEYLTKTGHDNITRPYLAESWDVSNDLKTWTFHLRKDVKWHNGRAFTAADVDWNLRHALDPETGSSMVGLMQAYMMNDDSTGLWDAKAIETPDDHTVRLNLRAAQVAVPEHLFHYPMLIIDPEEGGTFAAGSNGTGAFELLDYRVGEHAKLKARSDYWGEGPYVDELLFIDLGDDPSARVGAMASKQIDGVYEIDSAQVETVATLKHLKIYDAATAQTAVVRTRVDNEPFGDPRVRKALRLAVDAQKVVDLALQGRGVAAEHHHVSPVHPEYAPLPEMTRDIAAAKALLAEAGFPDGIDVEIAANADEGWEVAAVQVLTEMWKEAGIRAKINVLPGSSFWDVWDKLPFSMTNWTHRPLGIMVLALAYRTGVPWNESGYSNPEFDALLAEAESTLDVEDRRAVMEKIERLMQEDGPIVQPAWRSVFAAYDEKVQGFAMHPTSYIFANELAIQS
ncbi:MAG: ABC transporter substrate-binding protein [Rhodospirillales bacterium]